MLHLCDICNKSLSNKGNLVKHKTVVHEIIQEKKCKCGKQFSSSQSLNAHYRHCIIHRNGKPPLPPPNKGKISPFNGKKLEEIVKNPEETRMRLSDARKKTGGIPHTAETKKKLSEARLKNILLGKYDSSGKKGHRGHYNEMYFHSSWELAFYVYELEVNGHEFKRNTKWLLTYSYNNVDFRYAPDFISPDGKLFEVKGYLFSDRDNAKYEQTKSKVTYVLKNEIKKCLRYCKLKYGNKFWQNLYTDMAKTNRHSQLVQTQCS